VERIRNIFDRIQNSYPVTSKVFNMRKTKTFHYTHKKNVSVLMKQYNYLQTCHSNFI